MKYKVIYRTLGSLQAANKFLNSLYDKHDHARCINWPMNGEAGKYAFEVSNAPNAKLIPVVHSKAGKVQTIISHN
jgi:hypothetical protein